MTRRTLLVFFSLTFGISWGILGLIWAPWQVPAFFLSGTPQSNWSLPGFFLGCVALSLILTPVFNAARGSLLVAALFHFQVNGPTWPDAQP